MASNGVESVSIMAGAIRWGQRHRTVLVEVLIAALAVGTLLCLPLRPLWVDEIFQLEATRDQSFPAMLRSAMVAPGGMPLAYIAQKVWLGVAGFSTAQARVPAAIFGLATIWAMAWIARLLNVNAALVAIIGLLTPLLFRYSTEARPYSQGLFFSVLATALFLDWWQRPSSGKLLAYSLACLAGIYSQPFSLFVAFSHLAYAIFTDRKRIVPLFGALSLPVVLYTPWYLLSRKALLHEAWPHLMFFSWHQISPLMILREISGGGYICSVALLILAVFSGSNAAKRLLLPWAILPAVFAIGADAQFNYFFAIRQLLFVLPALIILAASGLDAFWRHRRWVAIVLAGIYLAGALVKDFRWQMDHKEDWAKAAEYISKRLTGVTGCVSFRPHRDAPSYYFFQPSLRSRTCESERPRGTVLVAVSPYAEGEERRSGAAGENVGNTYMLEVNKK